MFAREKAARFKSKFALLLLVLLGPSASVRDARAADISLDSSGADSLDDPDGLESGYGTGFVGNRHPVRLWPLFDVRSYDHLRDGEDLRLSEYMHSFEVEALWPLFTHSDWETFDGRRGGHTNWFPFFWSGWENDEGYSALFPLYWNRWGKERSWTHIFPFYGKYREGSYEKTFVLDPLISWGRDRASGEWDFNAFWPLVRFEGDGESSSGRILPLAFFGKSTEREYAWVLPLYFFERRPGKSGMRFLFPFYWERWREGKNPWHERVAFPFWGRFEWPGEEGSCVLQTLFPLYWGFRGQTEADVLFPLYWDFRKDDKRTRVVLPLYYERESEDREFRVLFPLVWDSKNKRENSRTVLAVPAYFLNREPGGESGVQAFGPLLWNWWHPGGQGWTFLPLFFHIRNREEDRTTNVLFPLLWSFTTPFSSTFHLWPLVGNKVVRAKDGSLRFRDFSMGWPFLFRWVEDRDENRTALDLLWPLVSMEKAGERLHGRVFPLLFIEGDRRRTTVLAPFTLYTRQGDDRDLSVLFPLFHFASRPGRDAWRLNTLWPLGVTAKEGDSLHSRFLPFWWYDGNEDRATLLAPFSLYTRRSTRRDLSVLFPVLHYSSRPEADAWRLNLLWPLFSAGRDKDVTHHRLLPLWWHDADENESLTVVPGLSSWHYSEDDVTSLGVLFPLFKYRDRRESGDGQLDLFWPLFCHRKEGRFTHSRLLPFWWHEGDRDSALTVMPPLLAFDRRYPQGGYGSVLFPLAWYSWKWDGRFEVRLLWELARYNKGAGDAWDFRVLYRLLHLQSRKDFFAFELNPVLRIETHRGRLTHLSLLGGALFSYDWDARRRSSDTRFLYFLRF